MRDTPLTNPRSLASSILIHALLLAAVSVLAVQVAAPPRPREPTVIRGELGPVDNTAAPEPGGGGPGALGGLGLPDGFPLRTEPDLPPVEQRLPQFSPAELGRNPPGLPISTGVGVLDGPGGGGGGGTGGGSGGGTGRGLGPGTVFFGTEDHAQSFVYLIDRSGSMSLRSALRLAKTELAASLDLLAPDARFAVFFYNLDVTPILDRLEPATAANKTRVRDRLRTLDAEGGTDHARALRAAFALRPEVVFFLTDGLLLTRDAAEALRSEAGSTRIHVIEFGTGPGPESSNPLKSLAFATGGTYRYVDVLRYRAPAG